MRPPLAPRDVERVEDLHGALVALIDVLPLAIIICHRGRSVLRNAAARVLDAPDVSDILDACRFGAAGVTRIARGDGARALECRVVPLPEERFAIVIADPDDDQIDGCALRELHGLTPAEIAIVRGLLRGGDPQSIANGAGVSTHTVRTHLRSIFARTGTRAQGDLIRVLLRGIATLRGAN